MVDCAAIGTQEKLRRTRDKERGKLRLKRKLARTCFSVELLHSIHLLERRSLL